MTANAAFVSKNPHPKGPQLDACASLIQQIDGLVRKIAILAGWPGAHDLMIWRLEVRLHFFVALVWLHLAATLSWLVDDRWWLDTGLFLDVLRRKLHAGLQGFFGVADAVVSLSGIGPNLLRDVELVLVSKLNPKWSLGSSMWRIPYQEAEFGPKWTSWVVISTAKASRQANRLTNPSIQPSNPTNISPHTSVQCPVGSEPPPRWSARVQTQVGNVALRPHPRRQTSVLVNSWKTLMILEKIGRFLILFVGFFWCFWSPNIVPNWKKGWFVDVFYLVFVGLLFLCQILGGCHFVCCLLFVLFLLIQLRFLKESEWKSQKFLQAQNTVATKIPVTNCTKNRTA